MFLYCSCPGLIIYEAKTSKIKISVNEQTHAIHKHTDIHKQYTHEHTYTSNTLMNTHTYTYTHAEALLNRHISTKTPRNIHTLKNTHTFGHREDGTWETP